MSFAAYMNFLEVDQPETSSQRAALRIKLDENFPSTEEYKALLQHVSTNAIWREPGALNDFKEAYAMYAHIFNIEVPWHQTFQEIQANKPEHFNTLPPEKKEILLDWIDRNLEPLRTKGYHSKRSSYRLKHNFEFSQEGFYITNGQFKGAMLAKGFKPKDYDELNWYFTLSKNAGLTVV